MSLGNRLKSFFSVLLRKRFWFIIILSLSVFLWKYGRPVILYTCFNISGTVSIEKTGRINRKRDNMLLIIVAKNENGIPIAETKIYNPKFPQPYRITSENIFYKSLTTKNYTLDFFYNKHGQISEHQHDDMFAVVKDTVPFFAKGIDVKLRTGK